MANERHSHPDDYTGERTKGRRTGTLWYSETIGEGDVTFFQGFDEMDAFKRAEVLTDWIAMLNRELRVQQVLFEKEMLEMFGLPEANQ